MIHSGHHRPGDHPLPAMLASKSVLPQKAVGVFVSMFDNPQL